MICTGDGGKIHSFGIGIGKRIKGRNGCCEKDKGVKFSPYVVYANARETRI